MATLRLEQAHILFFSRDGDAIVDEKIYLGTATEVEIPLREIVHHAFRLESPAILLSHNHPSGNSRPSTGDVEFTRRTFGICKALGIGVYDHLIISSNGSFSFREQGYM